jgi:hypothetical protein
VVGAVVVAVGPIVAWPALHPGHSGGAVYQRGFGLLLVLACVALGLALGIVWLAFFRPRIRDIGKVGLVCLSYLLVMGLMTWAPWIPPRTYVSPEIVGIVASADYDPIGVNHVKLVDGRTFELRDDSQANGQLSEAGRYVPLAGLPGAQVGDLLLAGESPTPWYTAASGPSPVVKDASDWCYWFDATGVERPDTVDLDMGLRLKKAAAYLYPSNGEFDSHVCLNREGEVTEIYRDY